jgi:hypothetical protein
MPQYDVCLEGNPGEAGLLLGTMIDLMAAFDSGEEGVLSSAADLTFSFTEMLRRRHFSKALRSLADTQLRSSVSCMLESITESYCKNYDARVLIEGSRDGLELTLDQDDLLYGYYILNRPLNVITDWMQKLLSGPLFICPMISSVARIKSKPCNASCALR